MRTNRNCMERPGVMEEKQLLMETTLKAQKKGRNTRLFAFFCLPSSSQLLIGSTCQLADKVDWETLPAGEKTCHTHRARESRRMDQEAQGHIPCRHKTVACHWALAKPNCWCLPMILLCSQLVLSQWKLHLYICWDQRMWSYTEHPSVYYTKSCWLNIQNAASIKHFSLY